MPRANAQTLRQTFDSAVFETAFFNQSQSARNCARRALPGRTPRRAFRAAAQARPETCFSRRSRRREVANVLVRHGWHRATRTAVNLRAQNADEEPSIEPRITRQACAPKSFPVNVHGSKPKCKGLTIRNTTQLTSSPSA